MDKQYVVVNGTSYSISTSAEVITLLEKYRISKNRIRIFYGKDGKCWNEENDIIGTIGRSTGVNKIPLLIHNSRSLGGGSMLCDCDFSYKTQDHEIMIVSSVNKFSYNKCEIYNKRIEEIKEKSCSSELSYMIEYYDNYIDIIEPEEKAA